MRILVVGSGGREHALAWKLSQEAEVLCSPGNPGIAADCEIVPGGDPLEIALARDVDLVVVGPEDPLVNGLADRIREAGIPAYGPGAAGAQLEGSKAFSKTSMAIAGVPTATFETFTDSRSALAYARKRFAFGRKVVVKASGLFTGKGVIVADTADEADEAILRMLEHGEFGDAGRTVVVEDRLEGREFSLLTIVGDENYVSLPIAQDHKQIFDGGIGPNTGGMGTYSPVNWVTPEIVSETERTVVEPILTELRKQGIPFRGTLFSGLMLEGKNVSCLEYNVRFGDPEIQTVVNRIGTGFADSLVSSATGRYIEAPQVLDNAVVSVVLASAGYPGPYDRGIPISLGDLPPGVKVFHAGTATSDGRLVTAGGRVLCVTATASTLEDARRLAYQGVAQVDFAGVQFRSDIGQMAAPSA
jgi:phosphoribosylamine--glycine ligase